MSYQVFVSHSSSNAALAQKIVDEIEKNGISCFIAPRNMTGGSEYAAELVDSISDCPVFLFLFTNESNNSGMVIREINEAVNTNRYIITLRIDNVEPNKSIRFYLSVNHWLNIDLPISMGDIQTILHAIANALPVEAESKEEKTVHYKGYHILNTDDIVKIGYTQKQINIACLNIDFEYLNGLEIANLVDAEISEEEWLKNYEAFPDLAGFLVCDDEIVGYYTFAFVDGNDAKRLIGGEVLTPEMFEFYEFGGELTAYVAFVPVRKGHNSGQNYKELINGFFRKLAKLVKDNDIYLNGITIVSYDKTVNLAMKSIGVLPQNSNNADGQLYILERGCAVTPKFRSVYPEIAEILDCHA